jgi:hypothetical protein
MESGGVNGAGISGNPEVCHTCSEDTIDATCTMKRKVLEVVSEEIYKNLLQFK